MSDNDREAVKEIADKYGIGLLDFGKILIANERKSKQRQFRVSDEEYSIIRDKAASRNMTLMCYCEFACNEFLKERKLDERLFAKQYGEGRERRIAVTFKNEETESELIRYSEQVGIEVGSLIRTCALSLE